MMNVSTGKGNDLHAHEDRKGKVPRWLPVSLLALTTVALTVPAVLLWRQKQALGPQTARIFGQKQHLSVPPARRRPLNGPNTLHSEKSATTLTTSSNASSSGPPPRRVHRGPSVITINQKSQAQTETSMTMRSHSPNLLASLIDGPVMSLGALGAATVVVGLTAALGVWGVQKTMGVQNVDEFASRTRQILLARLPGLSSRIHRSLSDEDGILADDSAQIVQDDADPWTWEAAESRLQEAFERGGIGKWAECAMRELEAERNAERRKRGL